MKLKAERERDAWPFRLAEAPLVVPERVQPNRAVGFGAKGNKPGKELLNLKFETA